MGRARGKAGSSRPQSGGRPPRRTEDFPGRAPPAPRCTGKPCCGQVSSLPLRVSTPLPVETLALFSRSTCTIRGTARGRPQLDLNAGRSRPSSERSSPQNISWRGGLSADSGQTPFVADVLQPVRGRPGRSAAERRGVGGGVRLVALGVRGGVLTVRRRGGVLTVGRRGRVLTVRRRRRVLTVRRRRRVLTVRRRRRALAVRRRRRPLPVRRRRGRRRPLPVR